jgi:hypothetical protein
LFAAPFALGCSLQNFDYLTHGGGDPESGAPDVTTPPQPEGSVGPDAGVDGTVNEASQDAPQNNQMDSGASEADGPEEPDVTTPGQDAGDAGGADVDAGPPNLITNWSFENGYAGWLFLPTTAEGKDAFTQTPVPGAHVIDGQYEMATWSGTEAFTVKIYQQLTNVPNGTYTFQGYFNLGMNNQVYLYSKNCGGPDQQANIPITGATQWESIAITGIQVTGGSCEVGFYIDAAVSNWVNADAFTFELEPPPPSDAAADAAADATTDGTTDAAHD